MNINNIQQRQNILNNTVNIGNNNMLMSNNNLMKSSYNINNYLDIFTSSHFDENNDNDNSNKKTLDEFKQLLRKIDEKLDAPLIKNKLENI